MSSSPRAHRHMAGIAAAAFLILVAAGSQLAIPPLLTSQVRAKLQQIATVRSLRISYPFPAVEALGGRIDSVQADQITLLRQTVARNLDLQKTGPHLRLSVMLDPGAIAPVLASSLGLPAGTGVQLTAAQSDPVLLISSPEFGGTIRLKLLAQDGTLATQLQLTPAVAARLGLPPGISPPPQPLMRTSSLTISQLTATRQGGDLRLTADGQFTAQ
jgi:hypothetical protein